ncbi:hypothetical protein [Pseudomonas synxantha]|uniref:Integrase catalytic domain-containing protein n=1 Tax=Pseudomonas synxantha TaxID=47883 RepID=A0A5D3GEL9_9PSED|nr:hypothetical protein [Pseudomonas synxantha]TYK57855.1 hypothetical protein FXO26_11340 [Pseudomonas synxantha]
MNNTTKYSINQIYAKVDSAQVPVNKREMFLRRRDAAAMRLDGASLKQIYAETGISPSEIHRLMDRFKTKDENGVCFGEAACIPGFRVKKYERIKQVLPKKSEQKGGMAGVMDNLLKAFPNILTSFIEYVFRRNAPVGRGMKYQKTLLFQDFYEICRSEGVSDNAWPLSQPRGAKKTISKLINNILEQNFQAAALAVGGQLSLIHTAVGNGIEPLFSQCEVLDVLEIDSHYLDGKFVLHIKGDRRLTTKDVIDRFWLICARCRKSKAIFSARYVFASQVTALDIFQVICDAYLGNWKPREKLSVTNLEYIPGAGMPYFVFPELRYHSIAAIYFDNAMQHYAQDVQDLCLEKLGIAVDYGPLGSPGRRTNIERLFKTLSSQVLHTLSSTTGSHPYDGRSDTPEEAAVYYDINVDEALEVLDVYIANFNALPSGGANKGNSPLEVIKAYQDYNMLFKPIVSELLVNSKDINSLCRRVTVRGSIAKGVRPRIKLDRALYTSSVLAEMPSLIGQDIIVRIDPDDYRTVSAFFINGLPLDILTVEAAWRDYRHSVQTRKLINRAIDKKSFQINIGQRPIIVYRNYLLQTKSARNNLALQRLLSENPELGDPVPHDKYPAGSDNSDIPDSSDRKEKNREPQWRSFSISQFEED